MGIQTKIIMAFLAALIIITSALGYYFYVNHNKPIFVIFWGLSLLIGIFFIFIACWIVIPLKKISATLYKKDLSNISKLQYKNNEFGNIARFITKSFHHEDELERTNMDLQAIAYVISHDLQEPVQKILSFSERLKEKSYDSLNWTGRDCANRIQRTAVRMKTLIHDLLTYSRITTKAQPFVQVNLSEVLQEVLNDFETRIAESNGQIEITGDFPLIDADPAQLRQLMQNLIDNALKFHKPIAIPIVKINAVTVNSDKDTGASSRALNPVCEICIEDNGIGIDEKYHHKIFGIFQRLHSQAEFEGTGIGLAICKKIVDRHQGTINIQSNPGKGAKFTVRLPLHQKGSRENY